MNTRTEERVDDWGTRPIATGYEGLHDLADDGFSGAVRARGTWLFMLNGRIVGVFEGEIEDFESASSTAYEAPDPSLPLLFTMLEKGGEQQAKYYTEDTPVAEADGTLSSGSFTGYIELSENVLSGDYYVVYYGGRSMKCAFVGNSEDLLTGDEAFERANDEVGIYEVRNVDIEVTDVPDPSGAAGGASDDASGGNATAGGPNADLETGAGADVADETGGVDTGSSPSGEDTAAGSGDAHQSEPELTSKARDPPASTGTATDQQAAAAREATTAEEPDPAGKERESAEVDDTETVSSRDEAARADGSVADSTPNGGTAPEPETGSESDIDPTHPTERESFGATGADTTDPPEAETEVEDAEASTETTESPTDASDSGTARSPTAGTDAAADDGPEQESWDADLGSGGTSSTESEEVTPDAESEKEWREAQTIPALDPNRTSTGDEGRRQGQSAGGRGAGTAGATEAQTSNQTSAANPGQTDSQRQATDRGQTGGQNQSGDRGAANGGVQQPNQQDEALKQEVLEREDKIDQLQQRVSNLQSEREGLRSERDDLQAENESLREEVEELEGEIQRLEQAVTRLKGEVEDARQAAGGAPNASQRISPAEALQGTNLFVRYASKGDATLSDARAGNADAEEVNANLRLEHHTQFESDDVAVDGQAFDEFLTNTLEFNFVDWIVGGLLYEIRDTGHATALEALYHAIPEIDRAELKGNVSLVYSENGDEIREQQQFDVVLRDRMGNPLVVADLNDARQPVTQDGMANLQHSASKVKETNEHLSSAFVVTSSFFEPGALETAAEATSGSFLSRDSKESFVKLNRKQGYHLCLVESRGRDFHLNVPEL
jgi:regulator of replication initiation timing